MSEPFPYDKDILMDAKTKIAKAKTRLVFKYPFFGSCALGLRFIQSEDRPTMATDGNIVYWNEDFVNKITDEEASGVLAHEVLHVIFKHCLRTKSNLEKWNYACDIAINRILIEEGFKLPENGVIGDEKYRGWNAEKIYNDLESWEMPNWGLLEQTKGKGGKSLSDAEIKQFEADLNVKILMAHETSKSIGKEPGSLIGELINQIKKPQIDWRDVFYRVIGGDQPDDYSWIKHNRKIYYMQGIYMPSVQKYGVGDIIIAIDTSGSVSNKEMEYFLTELNSITENYKPRSVTVIQCDSKIQKVDTYFPGEIIDSIECRGRGGTDCFPVFDYIEKENLPCDNFVYLTDLEMYRFPRRPEYPVLWVTTHSEEAPFGQITSLKMKEDN